MPGICTTYHFAQPENGKLFQADRDKLGIPVFSNRLKKIKENGETAAGFENKVYYQMLS